MSSCVFDPRLPKNRSLILLCLFLVLVISQVPSASSQASEDQEPTPVEAPPREWATLDVTIEAPDSLAAGMGQKAVVSITIANNGNISASGIIAIAEGGNILVLSLIHI